MYRGRTQLGKELIVGVRTHDGSEPAAPTAAPTIEVYSGTARVITPRSIPPLDRYGLTVPASLWQYRLLLDGRFDVGGYSVVYRWAVGSYNGVEIDTFEIMPGGHEDGAAIASYFYRRPNASYIVQQTDAGRIIKGKNPS